MTRVPPSRQPQAPARIIRPKRPQHVEKPVKLKAGGTEGEAEGGAPETAKPGEAAAHDPHEHAKLAEMWGPESHAEKAEEKKAKDEINEAAERAEGGGSDPKHQKGFLKQIKPALHSPPQQKKPVKDGFEQQQGTQGLKAQQMQQTQQAQAAQAKAPVAAAAKVQTPETTPVPRPSRPPDAFAVLHAAQDPGVYFKEDGHHGAAEAQNPELEEAIEETIRLLFGVRGILRVTGGFNQAKEPAIIVVATQGFGEASMKLVPAKVHRFETILAVPYDMLPLKRERP